MSDVQLACNQLRAPLQLQHQLRLVIHLCWQRVGVEVVLYSISRHLPSSQLGTVTARASVAAQPATDSGLVPVQEFGYLRMIVP